MAIPIRRNICGALYSAKRRRAVIEEYENRCDPLSARKVDLSRAPADGRFDLRNVRGIALRAVARQKAPAPCENVRFEDVLG